MKPIDKLRNLAQRVVDDAPRSRQTDLIDTLVEKLDKDPALRNQLLRPACRALCDEAIRGVLAAARGHDRTREPTVQCGAKRAAPPRQPNAVTRPLKEWIETQWFDGWRLAQMDEDALAAAIARRHAELATKQTAVEFLARVRATLKRRGATTVAELGDDKVRNIANATGYLKVAA